MRLYEFSPSTSPIETSLVGILNFLRYRAHDYNAPLDISTKELISMVQKSGVPFSYEALVQANKSKGIQNVISSFDKDTVKLRPIGDEFDTTEPVINKDKDQEQDAFNQPQQQPQQQEPLPPDEDPEKIRAQNRVDTMAKRAMSRRK